VKDGSGRIHAEGWIPATRHDLDCWMKNLPPRGVRPCNIPPGGHHITALLSSAQVIRRGAAYQPAPENNPQSVSNSFLQATAPPLTNSHYSQPDNPN
jgi:hypothetical protein